MLCLSLASCGAGFRVSQFTGSPPGTATRRAAAPRQWRRRRRARRGGRRSCAASPAGPIGPALALHVAARAGPAALLAVGIALPVISEVPDPVTRLAPPTTTRGSGHMRAGVLLIEGVTVLAVRLGRVDGRW